MKLTTRVRLFLTAAILLHSAPATAVDVAAYPQLQQLIETLETKHGFSRASLYQLFEQVEIKQNILEIMNRPGEARPWEQYRQLFVTVPHANRGSRFWRKHRDILARAESRFGVDPAIIVSIIGIESQYGRNAGRVRTIDALTTLGLEYPRRATFFRAELMQFLLLAREQRLDPLSVKGSYAGAMGAAQFIPSSYRRYAVDFDGDGRADLMNSRADAIGSVANYFKEHGWKHNAPVSSAAEVEGSMYPWLANLNIRPVLTLKQLKHYGIRAVESGRPDDLRASLITLDGTDGPIYRLGHDNFYVITRYNRNRKYAMAVYELSEMIRERFNGGTS
jgi:membrane-bound lytic murein transglycosylase B